MKRQVSRENTSVVARSTLTMLMALVALASISWGEAQSGPDGYRFSNKSARYVERVADDRIERYVDVRFATEWIGPTFPGWRECRFTVKSDDGSVIASNHLRLFAPERGITSDQTLMPVSTAESSSRQPDRVEVECDPDRLDNPDGHYAISNVTISPEEAGRTEGPYRVYWDTEWTAAGVPGVHECEVEAFSASGRRLFQQTFNFTNGNRLSRGTSFLVYPRTPPKEVATRAEVACKPL